MPTTNVKLAPFTLTGEFAIATEADVSAVLVGRAAAPYPPGNVLVNGAAFPATTSGDVTITWNHRYRLGPFIVAQNAGDVAGGPEGNYTIEIAINGILIRTVAGIAGKTFTYTRAQRLIDNANAALPTTITIIPVNGALSGTPRSLTFIMNP
jgi:hypothetical protein